MVPMDDIGRLSIAREISRKNTDFLRRIIESTEWEESLCRTFARIVAVFLLDDNIGWASTGHGDGNSRKKKHCDWWRAACGGQYDWQPPNKILVL